MACTALCYGRIFPIALWRESYPDTRGRSASTFTALRMRCKEAIYDAEKQAVWQVLKNRENADSLISKLKQLLDETNQSRHLLLMNTLARWQQANIQYLLQRYRRN